MQDSPVEARPLDALEPVLVPGRFEEVRRAADAAHQALAGRQVWNVSSTATGGGVAEMLQSLLGTVVSAGVQARWLVLEGDEDFFTVTKRLHNRLHGARGDDGELGPQERRAYDDVMAREARALASRVGRGDLVVLHDPQTAGLVPAVLEAGAVPVWRSHIGLDEPDERTTAAWEFLRPDVEAARAVVVSRDAYRPRWLPQERTTSIAPAIDPLAAKNAPMDDATVRAVLVAAGLLADEGRTGGARWSLPDGRDVHVHRRARVLREGGPLPSGTPVVAQVSRWDRLKDMRGLVLAFAEHVVSPDGPGAGGAGAHLLLVGPSVEGVSDDPEGEQVLTECEQAWRDLPAHQRRAVSLVSLPMDDVDENAAVVNAVQRHAAVVVQKSLVEGFGLTVSEAMWKASPVVASAVGGIRDQVVDGRTGHLVPPEDGAALGRALTAVLTDPQLERELGEAARERVREQFLPDRQLLQWAELVQRVLR